MGGATRPGAASGLVSLVGTGSVSAASSAVEIVGQARDALESLLMYPPADLPLSIGDYGKGSIAERSDRHDQGATDFRSTLPSDGPYFIGN